MEGSGVTVGWATVGGIVHRHAAEAGTHRPEGRRLEESFIVMPAEAGIHRPEGMVRAADGWEGAGVTLAADRDSVCRPSRTAPGVRAARKRERERCWTFVCWVREA